MAILIRRRLAGAAGPPATLVGGELAFNEVDGILYYGMGVASDGRTATAIVPIGGTNFTPSGGGDGGGDSITWGGEALIWEP